MKAPIIREHVHHVRTERGVSTYQIRKGSGKDAEVVAVIVVSTGSGGAPVTSCLTCHAGDCSHASRIKQRIAASL